MTDVVDHINMRNHLLQGEYVKQFKQPYLPIQVRLFNTMKQLASGHSQARLTH